jgi:CelD/BcsL family acetyltransferase involved in cellulose biosynthesis
VCDLVDIPIASALRTLTPPAGWQAAWQAGEPCPALVLPTGTHSAEDAIPAGQRRKLRMNRHRADRLGGWTVEYATPETVQPMLEALLRLHAGRWGAPDEAVRRFHRAAAPELLAAGLLRLAQLRIGGEVAACCNALADGGRRLMFYMIGFDPAFTAASPGNLLIGAMLDAALAEGRSEADFLRGNEAYKYAWGARDRHNAVCRLTRR